MVGRKAGSCEQMIAEAKYKQPSQLVSRLSMKAVLVPYEPKAAELIFRSVITLKITDSTSLAPNLSFVPTKTQ